MKIHIETERYTIDLIIDQKFIPGCFRSLAEILPVADDYLPHHLECLLEHDPAVTSVNVDYIIKVWALES